MCCLFLFNEMFHFSVYVWDLKVTKSYEIPTILYIETDIQHRLHICAQQLQSAQHLSGSTSLELQGDFPDRSFLQSEC